MSNLILEAQGLHKTYKDGKLETAVINGIDFQVGANETVAIIGSSGSGKSTLLHLLGGLDTPYTGASEFDGSGLFQLIDR
jgi:ABC-type antimicrobial peptide transport system, ATPase component